VSDKPKAWWEYLLDAMVGALTKRQLEQAGAGPEAMQGALTTSVDLPTFSAPVGPPPGLETSTDLAHCHPEFARRYLLVKADYEAATGRQLFITRTYSSPAYQFELFKRGRHILDPMGDPAIPAAWSPIDAVGRSGIVTNCDGYHNKSRHNVWPAEAADSCVDTDPGPGKHIVWDHASYSLLGTLALKHGLTWGGGWHAIHDDPHLELPAGAA
jgi:hypothetical protein